MAGADNSGTTFSGDAGSRAHQQHLGNHAVYRHRRLHPLKGLNAGVRYLPPNLTATPDDGRVSVTWDHPGNITIRKYQYSTDGGASFSHMNRSNQNTTSFTFKNLTNGTEYQLAIRASNLSGESAPATVTATPSD